MSLNEEVKSELVKEPQMKILAASLESTNDPVSVHFKFYLTYRINLIYRPARRFIGPTDSKFSISVGTQEVGLTLRS